MNRIANSTPPISIEGSDANKSVKTSSPSQSQIKPVDPSHSTLQGADHKIAFRESQKEGSSISNHNVTQATAASRSSTIDQGPEIKISGKDLRECIEHVAGQLAPFFQPCDEKNAAKIFLLDEKTKSIELHENTISSDSADLVAAASHEAATEEAKEFFVNHLTVLYGKAVVDCFYPEETREEPLTLGQAHLMRQQLNEFQTSVEAACNGDPSKYDVCVQAQLDILQQLKKSVAATFQSDAALKPQVDSTTNYLSKQLGVSPEAVQACVLTGIAISAVAAGAATGGVGLPAALHAAALSAAALSHGVGAGSAAASMIGSSHAAASSAGAALSQHAAAAATSGTTGAAHAPVGAGFARATAGVIGATVEGAGLGAIVGAVQGAAFYALDQFAPDDLDEMTETNSSFNNRVDEFLRVGSMAGMQIAFIGALLGPAALGVGVVAHPAMWGVYGAAIGGIIGSVALGIQALDIEIPDEIENFHNMVSSLSLGLPPQAQAILTVAAVGGVLVGAVVGVDAYLIGGLASLAAHSAATFAAAV